MSLTLFSICNKTSSVLSNEVPGGSETSERIAPVSSPGTKAFGVIFNNKIKIPAKMAIPKNANHFRFIKNSIDLLYLAVVVSNPTLNAV